MSPELLLVIAVNAITILGSAAGLGYKLGKIEGKLNGLPEDVDNLKLFKAAAEVKLASIKEN